MTKEKNYKEIIDRQMQGKIDKRKEYDEQIVKGEEALRMLWVDAPAELIKIVGAKQIKEHITWVLNREQEIEQSINELKRKSHKLSSEIRTLQLVLEGWEYKFD